MPTLHALFVGIDEHPDNPLKDAVHNAQSLHGFIDKNLKPNWKRNILPPLYNKAATRDNIIKRLENIQPIAADDVCLFYFAGHGSQEKAPVGSGETDGMLETIICYDSRRMKDGSYSHEIADKELAQIITKMTQNKGHLLAIMDCCHSGDNTRIEKTGPAVSTLPFNMTARSLDAFYGYNGNVKDYFSAKPNHTQLGACAANQLAIDGVFTPILIKILSNAKVTMTYGKVFEALKKEVSGVVRSQTPSLSTANSDLLFLKGAI